uniref:inositol monophosphatase family protein n=1 Tax=Ilumatobacter nonamiensis TaxID=467093 RepID=UPI0005906139
MTAPSARDLEGIAASTAAIAADLVHQAVGHATTLRTKSSATDVVTATDLRSEELIRNELERHVPGSSFIGEEYPEHTGGGEVTWVIDPIDGTVNF